MTYLDEHHPDYERIWQELKARVGNLEGWQYIGPNPSYCAHAFRLRAGIYGNVSGRNRIELVKGI